MESGLKNTKAVCIVKQAAETQIHCPATQKPCNHTVDKAFSKLVRLVDISEYLDDPEVIAEYLNAAIEENDPA